MKGKLGKVLKIIGISVLVLALVIIGNVFFSIWKSYPQTSGTIALPGLQSKVEVQRDKFGVPHIYAQNSHDLFMVQGYLHASDRFWQMDFWRHIGSGRLAEMFGEKLVKNDSFLRTMGWARVAKQEIAQLTPSMSRVLEAYSEGVNVYLNTHQDSALSLEYTVLKLSNPNYKVEPWQPLHTLTWGKVMAWDLSQNMKAEIERTVLSKNLTSAQLGEIFPDYPSDRPLIINSLPTDLPRINSPTPPPLKPEPLSIQPLFNSDAVPKLAIASLKGIERKIASLENLIGKIDSDIGSNSWVISSKRTINGKPILANDPHLGVQMPSIWYEVGLHCSVNSPDCPYEVTGFSFPGAPNIVIGHNDYIAWGVTNSGADVMDLYIEKVNPQNPNQYEVNGKWVDMELISEPIQVANSSTITQTVRYTRHGPVISDTYAAIKDFGKTDKINLPANYAIALRWTALEPSKLVYALPAINSARTWTEFRAATANYDVPSQNFIYADIDGNIGYVMPGKIPVRTKGDGRYPVNGWTDEYEWKAYIPTEQLPYEFNSNAGYIATANNAVTSSPYAYMITKDWDYGSRAQRLVELLKQSTQKVSLEDMQQVQMDNYNLNAANLVPTLLQIDLGDSSRQKLEQTRDILKNWDSQQAEDSAAGALFQAFWRNLLADTFHDELPKDYWPRGGDRWVEVVRRLVQQPNSNWWDDKNTPTPENRDYIFRKAFAEAVTELESSLGKDPKSWRWGKLHTVTFRNATLGKSGVGAIEALFNRGPFSTSGGSAIVNATGWDASTSSYAITALPSMRMIVDLDNWENGLTINSTGQSGHAFHHHYTDMIGLWRTGKYHPMFWKRNVVSANTEDFLTLVPQ